MCEKHTHALQDCVGSTYIPVYKELFHTESSEQSSQHSIDYINPVAFHKHISTIPNLAMHIFKKIHAHATF